MICEAKDGKILQLENFPDNCIPPVVVPNYPPAPICEVENMGNDSIEWSRPR